MGQRHQIYIRTIDQKNKEIVFGFHHQWLFGKTAVKTLLRVLKFCENDIKNSYSYPSVIPIEYSHDNAIEALKSVLQVDIDAGYFHRVSSLTKAETEDPRKGDNNNGITVIDLTGECFKYCFTSLHHLECLANKESERIAKQLVLKPIDIETWLSLHYPLNPEHEFYEEWKNEDVKENISECLELIKLTKRYKVLTLKELKSIFPKMYS